MNIVTYYHFLLHAAVFILVYAVFALYRKGKTDGDNRELPGSVYQKIFSDSECGIAIINNKGRVIKWNRQMEEIYDIPADEAETEYIWNLRRQAFGIREYDEKRFVQLKNKILNYLQKQEAGWLNIPLEHKIISHDGDKKIAQSMILRIDHDKEFYTACFSRDITEKKAAETNVRESQRNFLHLAESLPVGIFKTDKKGWIKYVNPQFKQATGIELLSDRDISWREILLSGEIEHPVPDTEEGLFLDSEFRLSNGKWIRCKIISNYAHSKFQGFIGIITDITDYKTALNSLLNERKKFSRTFEYIGDAVLTIDNSGICDLINRKAVNLLKISRDSCIGQHYSTFFKVTSANKQAFCPVEKSISEKTNTRFPSGTCINSEIESPLYIDGSSCPIILNGEICGAVIIFRDITNSARMTEALNRTEELESIGLLTGGLAHDFNNLLTSITGNMFLAIRKLDSFSPASRFIGEAQKAAEIAKNITGQLLSYAKKTKPVLKPEKIEKVVSDAARFALTGSKISYSFKADRNIPACDIDPGQIAQVINNLTLNATQAMPEGGELEITISVADSSQEFFSLLKYGNNFIKISITDNGPGIPPEKLDKIFNPYFTTKKDGSGLGLANSLRVIKQHNGHILVSSVPGKETCFSIFLPPSKKKILKKTITKESKISNTGGKVLLMDDEQYILDTTKELLKYFGYEVVTTSSGPETLMKYRESLPPGKEKIDAVILDLTLPGGMGGKEVISKLKKLDPEVKAIVSSGYPEDPAMTNFSDFGFMAKIKKPYDVYELNSILSAIINCKVGT
ncbi:MAG: ATP-binding protein [Fibrobacterota bacterium]